MFNMFHKIFSILYNSSPKESIRIIRQKTHKLCERVRFFKSRIVLQIKPPVSHHTSQDVNTITSKGLHSSIQLAPNNLDFNVEKCASHFAPIHRKNITRRWFIRYITTDPLFLSMKQELSQLPYHGAHQRFLVNRLGSTGSTWLAKVLNSHPDVLCFHEGVIMQHFQKEGMYTNDDIIKYIKYLSIDVMHNAYAAVGDVGSVYWSHLLSLSSNRFKKMVLIRHPLRVLNSRLDYIRKGITAYTPIGEKEKNLMREIFELTTCITHPDDWFFLNDCFNWCLQCNIFDLVDCVIQIEKTKDRKYTKDILFKLTNLVYSDQLLENFINTRVNVRIETSKPTQEIFNLLTENQKKWYLEFVDPLANELTYYIE